MTNLMIILGSVREGRVGEPIADWVRAVAEADSRFTVDFADLAEIALPLMDEPHHPRQGKYTKAHTIAWSERVAAADAFIFLVPEYNHSYSPAIKNALDYLAVEWSRKPVGFVNWGGVSGGTRAQVALKPVVDCLGMVLTRSLLEINFPHQHVSEEGVFEPSEAKQKALQEQLDELAALAVALKPLQ